MSPSLFSAESISTVVAMVVIFTGLLQSFVQLVQLGLAFTALLLRPPAQRLGLLWNRYADVAPPIAFLVPAYNEERNIVDSVHSLLAMQYPKVEVIVVNDGSTDRTISVLAKSFGLIVSELDFDDILPHKGIRAIFRSPREPRLLVVDKINGGKADALNCAVNLARSPLVCSIDADSMLEPDALLRAVRPFIDYPDRTIAVGATVRVANGCRVAHGRVLDVRLSRNILALFQTVEYLRAFLMARLAWSEVGLLTIVSGAFGLFRRKVVIEVGGYSADTVGEDFELVVKMHRYMREHRRPYRIEFVPEPVCWTEVPESLSSLARQRTRWQRGALQTFFKHIIMLGRPKYGRVGVVGYTNMLLTDLISPIAELLGYVLVPILWALGLLSFEFFIAFLALSFSFGLAISAGSFILQEMELRNFAKTSDLVVLLIAAVAENFGYRQLNNVWRFWGFWEFLVGKQGWGSMARKGFHGPV